MNGYFKIYLNKRFFNICEKWNFEKSSKKKQDSKKWVSYFCCCSFSHSNGFLFCFYKGFKTMELNKQTNKKR